MLTHIDPQGHVKMVDVTDKAVTDREATASGKISMRPETLRLIAGGQVPKGNVLETARIAGAMAAKRASDLIPMCHPLGITGIDLRFDRKYRHRGDRECARARAHGRGDGSPNRGQRGAVDDLRHVQSRGPRHGHRRDMPTPQKRRAKWDLCPRRIGFTMSLANRAFLSRLALARLRMSLDRHGSLFLHGRCDWWSSYFSRLVSSDRHGGLSLRLMGPGED